MIHYCCTIIKIQWILFIYINNEYLKFKCDVIEQKLYWSDIEKVKFSKDYILIKYKSEMIFISKGENVEKFKGFENYVKEYYVANKLQNQCINIAC